MLKLATSLLVVTVGAVFDTADYVPGRKRGHCTALGLGKKATWDGSTVTTHNADCEECDFRINHVPSRDWEAGSKRPVFRERLAYPRLLETSENNIHGPSYLFGTEDSTIYPWTPLDPILFVDQIPHTYAYTMGVFPVQNEKQLTMGESTCETNFWSIPSYFDGGKANFNIRGLMELAMERCETARCAITTMGYYSIKYGFYGVSGGPKATDGEALIIGDTEEVWVFHIVADDTHESAVWAAQRLPDDHITVIANQFIIQEIDLSDPDNFMASANIFEVAERTKLWDSKGDIPFNFLHIYGKNQGGLSQGSTRRMWRGFTMAAPSISISPFTDNFATFGFGPNLDQPYPFSVAPDSPMKLESIMRILRDNYEGTPFDLTEGPDSGPFGDVVRASGVPSWKDPVNGLAPEETNEEDGTMSFPNRAISLWRTSYGSIAQARSSLPNEIGALTWFAQYAPHHSSFVPVYANADKTPQGIDGATLYKFDKTKNFWVHSLVGNYVSRWFKWTIEDVRELQKGIEAKIFEQQHSVEQTAISLLSTADVKQAVAILQKFQEEACESILTAWWDFFYVVVVKYRDIAKMVDFHAENYLNAREDILYSREWMELVGFWGPPGTPGSAKRRPMGVRPMVFHTQPSQEDYNKVYPDGADTRYYITTSTVKPASADSLQQSPFLDVPNEGIVSSSTVLFVMGAMVGVMLKVVFDHCAFKRYNTGGYILVPDIEVPNSSNDIIDNNML